MSSQPAGQGETRPNPALDRLVADHAASGHWPGAVYAAGPPAAEPLWSGAVGRLAIEPAPEPVRVDALYDLASLTKPLATAAVLLRLADRGEIDLDRPLDGLLPELFGYAGATPSFSDLMLHRSGLPAWCPLYRAATGPAAVPRAIAALPPAGSAGSVVVYSCLGPILAGIAVERATGRDLRALVTEEVCAPLGIPAGEFGFGPFGGDAARRCAPTERGRARETELAGTHAVQPVGTKDGDGILRGIVHDGNANFLGGAAGNAGVFATAAATFRVASAMAAPGAFLSASAFRRIAEPAACGREDVRTFGFQSGVAPASPAGSLGPASFGHTGFTGTSVWIAPGDAETGPLVAVLLSNRVHPRWSDAPTQRWRREYHDTVAALARRNGL